MVPNIGAVFMSFALKVAALRTFFGTPADAPLHVAVQIMNESMGMLGESALPCGLRVKVEKMSLRVCPVSGLLSAVSVCGCWVSDRLFQFREWGLRNLPQ